ncbi:MAG: hypothetical protein NT121_04625 [Chloroflexi bacterium]|nr:hypothetical protein [Chloroflexota bacterium]
MPLEKLTNFEDLFRQRLKFVMVTCGIKNVQLVQEFALQYHAVLSEALVSRWLSGERKITSDHYARVKTLLAGHLKAEDFLPEFGFEQEMWDWDGLKLNDNQLEQGENRHQPAIIGNMLRDQPGAGHFYRKSIRDDILMKLLNPDPQSGLFRPGIVALTGLPGSGKSEMLLEVLERATGFFSGGILFANLRNSSKAIWQDWGASMQRSTNLANTRDDIERQIRSCQGRWLLVVENVQDGQKLQSILPAGRFWVLATMHGIAALQPLGWE